MGEAKRFSEHELRTRGMEALVRAMGPIDAVRFVALLHREPTDYVKISRRLFEGQTLEQILERAPKQRTMPATPMIPGGSGRARE